MIKSQRKASTDHYRVYNYLKFHRGIINAISMNRLALATDLTERRIRKVIEELNDGVVVTASGTNFKRKIGHSHDRHNGGYYLVSNRKEADIYVKQRVQRIRKIGNSLQIALHDFGLDNQTRITFTKHERKMIKSISNDKGVRL
jgi:hypothetical protein